MSLLALCCYLGCTAQILYSISNVRQAVKKKREMEETRQEIKELEELMWLA